MKIRRYLQIKRTAMECRNHALAYHIAPGVSDEIRSDGDRLLALADAIDELCQLIETEENEDA